MKFRFTAEHFNPVYGTVIDDVMLQTLVNLSNVLLESGCARLSREAEMFKFLKQMFCHHEFRFHQNIYGDQIILYGYKRSVWRCVKCGKFTLRDELFGVPSGEFKDK